MYGREFAYAHSRLQDTVVFTTEGEPVHVSGVGERGDAHICPLESLPQGEYRRAPLSTLDVKPRPLGYVNYNGAAVYIVRKPKRRDWRQGIRHNNLTCRSFTITAQDIPMHHYSHMLKGEYPSFRDALQKVSEAGVLSVAWKRQWAVDNARNLVYRGTDIVGKVVDETPLLSEEFQWLQECLQEALQ